MTSFTTIQAPPPPSDCGWSGCGHRAPVEVFIMVPGKPTRAGSVGAIASATPSSLASRRRPATAAASV
jgi:hypothetical protein